ncbi:DUF262 domain-containing protein [Parashewanella tropica]|uniref:DUF262 domain-containing protein n=1 Tax=Parashewanella tropica TaxID=2547970 RepID=UPI001059C761|nr:DUF262 domain-containing protein [Parashewanella tropica]
MAIENLERELGVIYNEIDNDKLVLPNFQRSFVWTRDMQKKLLASTLVDLPIGSLLTLEGESSDFCKRKLCFPDDLELTIKYCEYVLDGQQRLTTLRAILFDLFSGSNWESNWNNMFGSLRTRWFLSLKVNGSDIFGYNNLNFRSLSKFTDSEIEPHIEFKAVHKTKTEELHHPANTKVFRGKASDKYTKSQLASKFADQFLVPLWEVYEGDKGIHKRIIDKIAEQRCIELKDELIDNLTLDNVKCMFAPLEIDDDDLNEIFQENKEKDGSSMFQKEFSDLRAAWVKAFTTELNNLVKRKVPIVQLKRGEIDRAVSIFEAINRGGEPLSVYDLIVAKSARNREQHNLTQMLLNGLSEEIKLHDELICSTNLIKDKSDSLTWNSVEFGAVKGNEPTKIVKDWFVNLLTLLAYTKSSKEPVDIEHIKREKALRLTADQVNAHIEITITAINRALAFLNIRCGVVSCKDVQYKLMLVVLGYFLSDDDVWTDKSKLNKLEYWYWVIVFGGGYAKAQNTRCIKDITDVERLLSGKNLYEVYQDRMLNVPDYVTKDILLRRDDATDKESKSVRNTILQFVLSKSPLDLFPEQGKTSTLNAWDVAFNGLLLELHHLIPLANVKKIGETSSKLRKDSQNVLNSTLNLSYISKDANRKISSYAPDVYFQEIKQTELSSHFIKPELVSFENCNKAEGCIQNLEDRFSLLQNAINNHVRGLI